MGRRERRIKRRLLRQVVDDNVGLIAGRRPQPRRRRGPWVRALRTSLLMVAPAALLASTLVLSGAVGPEPVGAVAPAAVAPPAVPEVEPEAGPSAAERAGRVAVAADRPLLLGQRPIDAAVFPLEIRRIVLDPGHGGGNLGTKTPGGLEEKFLTLDIARRVGEVLAARGFDVVMTRTGDESVTLQQRAALANAQEADIFVSVHVNWLVESRASGIETYFLGPADDPYLTELAARENRDSGHSLAEMRELLDGIYAGVRNDKSRELAAAIHRSLVGTLRRVNPSVRDRGVKSAPFLVLVDTSMPAVLAEVAALSNRAEAAMLEKPLYRAYIADALAAGIIDYAEGLERSARTAAAAP